MLIKSFGLNWNPDVVEWGKRGPGNNGQLMGDVYFEDGKKEIDFWEARGIYVLLKDFKCVYVGKANSTCIGKRLRDHLTDRLAGRWDMFSWFSVSAPRKVQGGVTYPGKRQIAPDTYINTFEALAILISDAPLNRKRESFKDAYQVMQSSRPHPKAIRTYLEEILNEVKT